MLTIDFKRKAEKLLENYPKGGTLSYFDFQQPIFAPPYNAYILNELDRLIMELTELIESLPYFKFNENTGKGIKEEIFELIRSNVKLSVVELNHLLVSALKLRFNFLIQPHSTLLFFIFDKSTKKKKSEILELLTYFSDYPHIIQRLKQWLIDCEKSELSKYEFYFQLRQIELEYFDSIDAESLSSLFEPMCDFFESELEQTNFLPSEAIAMFFEDIGLKSFSNFFKNYSSETNSKSISYNSLKGIFANILKENRNTIEHELQIMPSSRGSKNVINFTKFDPFVFTLPAEIPALSKEKIEAIRMDSEKVSIAKPSEIEEIKDLLARFDSMKEKEPILTELETTHQEAEPKFYEEASLQSVENFTIEKEQPQNPSYHYEQDINQKEELQTTNNQKEELQTTNPVTETYGTDLETTATENVAVSEFEALTQDTFQDSQHYETSVDSIIIRPTLLDLISPEQKVKFIEELFYTMEDVFQEIVTKIDNSSNLDEAMKHLDDYFKEFGIFEDAPIAKEFINIVQLKFH